jgi:hypothetical protein
MKKLHEILNVPLCKGSLGVEIECEGKNLSVIDSPHWRTERDGSLRGNYPDCSAEYVMRKPVSDKQFPGILRKLIDHQAQAQFAFSFRTSVHVHVNAQELTEDELLAFLYACFLLEEPLMNFCGESRKANRFCLRIRDAEGYAETLNSLFENGFNHVRYLNGDRIRYSAINIHALTKYGSVEFRGMRGNMDPAVLVPWCNTLLSIRENARKLGSPAAVYNDYVSKPNIEFAKQMLGKHFDMFNYEGIEADINNSFSLTIDLPHTWKNRPKVDTSKVPWDANPFAPPPAPRRPRGIVQVIQDEAARPAPPPKPAWRLETFGKASAMNEITLHNLARKYPEATWYAPVVTDNIRIKEYYRRYKEVL